MPALKALPHYELTAVCTSREDTAKASAAAFGAKRAFHRFSDMAADPDADLIVVCVRVPGHRELVMAGLQAGKAVLCEWPLGANLAEAEEMAGLASQRAVKTIVGLQARAFITAGLRFEMRSRHDPKAPVDAGASSSSRPLAGGT